MPHTEPLPTRTAPDDTSRPDDTFRPEDTNGPDAASEPREAAGAAASEADVAYELHRLQLSFPGEEPTRRTGAGVAAVDVEVVSVDRIGRYPSMDKGLQVAAGEDGWFALFCVPPSRQDEWPSSDERVLLGHASDLCENCQYPTHLTPENTYKLTLSMWDVLEGPEALCLPCLSARMQETKNRKLRGRDFPQAEENWSNPYVRKLWRSRH